MKDNIEKEIWKDIPGYEDIYQVSSEGRVKSLERYVRNKGDRLKKLIERCLTQSTNSLGYSHVCLSKDGVIKTHKTYKLVAMAFLGHKPCGYNMIVDHINNDRSDNRLTNLQIISQRQNITKNKKSSSGFTGVTKVKTGRYRSRIYDKKQIYLGTFDTPEEAHQAYLKKLKEITDNNL